VAQFHSSGGTDSYANICGTRSKRINVKYLPIGFSDEEKDFFYADTYSFLWH